MNRFEQLITPHLGVAWRVARGLTRNDADAQDILQEACMRAFRYFERFQGDDARAWLLTIVRHSFYDSLPVGQPLQPLDEDDEPMADWSYNPERLAERAELRDAVNTALQTLPPAYREAIVLREMADCSYREIAHISGTPIGTVMSRLARGRELLLRALTAQEN
ncbi:sigma-70 family RNA polymerase sigma factor [Andreprevotia chitinilytica]|uniref:sigma-70 family RNA polymerase sigma factor n=1 Tax=Andreprevotia chitinilytica TaxID=396808 RepID=UPI00068C6854|nr:sigma-70 family RNA polymerase sigma factor [Andreprevotia chitinilytica]